MLSAAGLPAAVKSRIKSEFLVLQHSAELVYSRHSGLLGLDEKTGNAGGHRRFDAERGVQGL